MMTAAAAAASAVVVEGHMGVLDESSSSSGSDSEVDEIQPAAADEDDDDEEVIEVFGEGAPVPKQKPKPKPMPRAYVAFGVGRTAAELPVPPAAAVHSVPLPPPLPPAAADDEDDDEFAVLDNPNASEDRRIAIASIISSVATAEEVPVDFAAERAALGLGLGLGLGLSSNAADTSSSVADSLPSFMPAVLPWGPQTQGQKPATSSSLSSSLALASSSSADEPLLLAVSNPNPPPSVSTPSGGAGHERILEAARRALGDVVEVYGAGLGDQDVLLGTPEEVLDREVDAGLGVLGKIEEEEEDEEEDEGVAAAGHDDELSAADGDEWDRLPVPAPVPAAATACVPVQVLTYPAALEQLLARKRDLTERYGASIITTEEAPKTSWLLRPFAKQLPPLTAGLADQLPLPFLLAQLDYDPVLPLHRDMLLAVYRGLVKEVEEEVPPAAQDARWERLGFQGRDPRTDLNRSMKLLSVLQMMHFLHSNPLLCRQVFRMSQSDRPPASSGVASDDSSWPYACVAVLFTKEALQLLRSGRLNKYCNEQGDVLQALHLFHQACFFDFAVRMLREPRRHHALHLADLRAACARSPGGIYRQYVRGIRALPEVPDEEVGDGEGEVEGEVYDDLAAVEEVRADEQAEGQGQGRAAGKANRFLDHSHSHSHS